MKLLRRPLTAWLATSDPKLSSDAVMTWHSGITLGSGYGNISLSSLTGWTRDTTVDYYYTVNGYFCGTNAAAGAGAHNVTAALTMAGT